MELRARDELVRRVAVLAFDEWESGSAAQHRVGCRKKEEELATEAGMIMYMSTVRVGVHHVPPKISRQAGCKTRGGLGGRVW